MEKQRLLFTFFECPSFIGRRRDKSFFDLAQADTGFNKTGSVHLKTRELTKMQLFRLVLFMIFFSLSLFFMQHTGMLVGWRKKRIN